ncbi:MAG: hypothetical protein U1F54_09420 [Burkholderiales bacterium]
MPAAPTPIFIAGTVARNIVPLGGILFLGWSAPTVLVLYFADTMLTLGVMAAGLCRYFTPPPADDSLGARAKAEASAIFAALLVTAAIAVPLGIPLIFMFADSETTLDSLWRDPAFRTGLLMQAIAAFWSCVGLYRALRTHTPEELGLKRRFALVFLRWIAVLMVLYTGLAFLFGSFAPFVFVVAYVAVSIVVDVAPDRFLDYMPKGFGDEKAAAPPAPNQRHSKHRH